MKFRLLVALFIWVLISILITIIYLWSDDTLLRTSHIPTKITNLQLGKLISFLSLIPLFTIGVSQSLIALLFASGAKLFRRREINASELSRYILLSAITFAMSAALILSLFHSNFSIDRNIRADCCYVSYWYLSRNIVTQPPEIGPGVW